MQYTIYWIPRDVLTKFPDRHSSAAPIKTSAKLSPQRHQRCTAHVPIFPIGRRCSGLQCTPPTLLPPTNRHGHLMYLLDDVDLKRDTMDIKEGNQRAQRPRDDKRPAISTTEFVKSEKRKAQRAMLLIGNRRASHQLYSPPYNYGSLPIMDHIGTKV